MRRCFERGWRERSRSRERSQPREPGVTGEGCSNGNSVGADGGTVEHQCITSTSASSSSYPELHFLYAAPLDHRLREIKVHAELELLQEALQQAQCNARIRVGIASSRALAQHLTLARRAGEGRAAILHISAHVVQTSDQGAGLVLESGNGSAHVLYRQQLDDLLSGGSHLGGVPLIFLNCCWSEGVAQSLVEAGCKLVIATRGQVPDLAARIFMRQFYLALGSQQSVLAAWENAQQVLRIDPNPQLPASADLFVLFGQRNASSATFWKLDSQAGVPRSPSAYSPSGGSDYGWDMQSPKGDSLLEDVDDASAFDARKLPPRVEDFVGRSKALCDILSNFDGSGGTRRICVLHGPQGVGKTAVATELAHFASSPGRQFSRSVIYASLSRISDGHSVLEAIAAGLRATLPETMPTSAHKNELHTHVLMAWRNLDQRRGRSLLILDDAAGVIQASLEVRHLLSAFIEMTQRLCIIVFSRSAVYASFASCKGVNMQLPPLSEHLSAELFLRRIHRPLRPCDLTHGASCKDIIERSEELVVRLASHPLLRELGGNPGLLRTTAEKVTPQLRSLFDLCTCGVGDVAGGRELRREMSVDETAAGGTALTRKMSIDETRGNTLLRTMSVDETPGGSMVRAMSIDETPPTVRQST